MSCNSHYVVLFNMPANKRQILSMSTQMFPENPQHMLRAYEEAIKISYGFLLVDLKPDTPSSESLKARVNIKRDPISVMEMNIIDSEE